MFPSTHGVLSQLLITVPHNLLIGFEVSGDGNARLGFHDVTTGDPVYPTSGMFYANLANGGSIGRGIASPDGSLIALAYTTGLYVISTATKKVVKKIALPSKVNERMAWSSDGRYLALARSDVVVVYDTLSWSTVTLPSAPTAGVKSVAFSPDASRFVVGGNSTPFIHIYETSGWTKLADPATLPGGAVVGLDFNSAGTRLAAIHGGTPFCKIYDPSDWSIAGTLSAAPEGSPKDNSVAFSPDGSTLVIGHATSPFISRYETSGWTELASLATPPNSGADFVAFNPDGSKLFVGGIGTGSVQSYETSGWTKLANVVSDTPRSAIFLPSEDLIIFGIANDPSYMEFKASTMTLTSAYNGLPVLASSMAVSPDDSVVAVTDSSAVKPDLQILSLPDFQVLALPSAPSSAFSMDAFTTAFSPDGNRFFCAANGAPYLYTFDTSTWTEEGLTGAMGIGSTINWIAVSPDGNILALHCSATPNLRLYDANTLALLATQPPSLTGGSTSGIGFSRDSTLVHRNSRVFNVSTGVEVTTGVPAASTGCAFSPTEDKFAISHNEATDHLYIYETIGWTQVQSLVEPVSSLVQYSPDGSRLYIGSTKCYDTSAWTPVTYTPFTNSGGVSFTGQLTFTHNPIIL